MKQTEAMRSLSLVQNTTSNNDTPYCPKCLTQGKKVVSKYFYPPENIKKQPIALLCDGCEEEEKAKAKAKEASIIQAAFNQHKKAILPLSDIGVKYEKSSFSNFNGAAEGLNDCHIWAKRFTERVIKGDTTFSLYIYGTTGCGKTELQACSYNDVVKANKNSLFTTLGKLFECMHDYDNVRVSEVYKIIRDLDALFLDDFAATPLDKKSRGWLFELFDLLDKYQIPTFISSNLNKSEDILSWMSGGALTEIEAIKTKRVLSRIIRNFKRIENKAADYSPIKAMEIEKMLNEEK